MPYDGSDFDPPRPQPAPRRGSETALLVALGLLAFLAFALPVPFAALADIVHYLVGRR